MPSHISFKNTALTTQQSGNRKDFTSSDEINVTVLTQLKNFGSLTSFLPN